MTMTENGEMGWTTLKKHFMRTAVASFLSDGDLQKKVNSYNFLMEIKSATPMGMLSNEDYWQALVDAMVQEVCKNWVTKDLRKYKDWANDTYKATFVDQTVNRKRWAVGMKGKILLSDDSQKTITFDDKGEVKATENLTFTDKNHKKMREFLKSIGTNVE